MRRGREILGNYFPSIVHGRERVYYSREILAEGGDKRVAISGLDHSICKCIKNDFFLTLELKAFDDYKQATFFQFSHFLKETFFFF